MQVVDGTLRSCHDSGVGGVKAGCGIKDGSVSFTSTHDEKREPTYLDSFPW